MNILMVVIYCLALVVLLFMLFIFIKRRSFMKLKEFSLTDLKDFIYNGAVVVNQSENGALLMKDLYLLEYIRQSNNGSLNERVIISNYCPEEFANVSVEIIFDYLNGDFKKFTINGCNLDPDANPDDYIAAHKFLELSQHAWCNKYSSLTI